MCRVNGSQNSCTAILALPNVVAALAVAVSLVALIVLGCQYLSVAGTTATVTYSFKIQCLAVAKWSAIVAGSAVALAIIRDVTTALYSPDSRKDLSDMITCDLLSPCLWCCMFRQ